MIDERSAGEGTAPLPTPDCRPQTLTHDARLATHDSPYAAAWEALVAGRDSQRGADQRDGDPQRDPWAAGRAERFAAYSRELPDDDSPWVRLRAAVRPDDTLLDVGAGTGRYALPLAALAREVVAVEPSPAMRRHLDERIAAAGVANLRVVGAAWPEANVSPADVTICAHVVYGVRQIAPFLRALDAHTRRLCLIGIRVDQHPGIGELSRDLFGEDRVRQPALLDLYGALLELGIAADVQIIPASGGFRFADVAEATAHFRDRLRVPPDSPTADRLQALVAARLVQDPDGRWRWPTPPPRNAIVSWQKEA
jgi:SAM-dependent methyltransferase